MTTYDRKDEVVGHAAFNGRLEPPVTIRRYYEDDVFTGADVFVGGWRVGSYKTEQGATRRAEREVGR